MFPCCVVVWRRLRISVGKERTVCVYYGEVGNDFEHWISYEHWIPIGNSRIQPLILFLVPSFCSFRVEKQLNLNNGSAAAEALITSFWQVRVFLFFVVSGNEDLQGWLKSCNKPEYCSPLHFVLTYVWLPSCWLGEENATDKILLMEKHLEEKPFLYEKLKWFFPAELYLLFLKWLFFNTSW